MKQRITTYIFDASEKTITFSEGMDIEGFLVITNVVDNIVIYNFADPSLGGDVTGSILTLDYNTTSMSDTDELQIFYDDGITTTTVDGTIDTGLDQPLTDTQLRATAVPVSGTFYPETQPISGTVTANLGTVDNAVLDDIALDTEAIKDSLETTGGQLVNLGANNDVTVEGSVTANAGANLNTSALALETGGNLAGIKTNTDDIETLLTTIEGNQLPDGHNITVDNVSIPVTGDFYPVTQPVSGTITETNSGAIKTAVEKIDDAISGSEMQVDVVSMPTTTIQATNLDVRDLDETTDSVAIYGSDDGGTTKRIIKTDEGGAIQVDLEVSEITVDNVTIDNGGGASAVNIQDGGNSVTVDGTVTANLSATDNTVLDNIDSNTDSGSVVGAGSCVTAQRVHLADESLSALENITVTSSGTVTANAGTDLNTSALALESGGNLDSIKAKTDNIPALGQALASASVPVVLPAAQITTLTPPAAITGYSTSAKQDTIIGHIDGIEGSIDGLESAVDGIEGMIDGVEALLGTIDADTSNITTKIDTVAGAVAGTEMQVDVLTMPTTTVNGTVTANLSATDNAVLDDIVANQTDASQKTQIVDGSGNVIGATSNALDVNIKSGAASGTQYTQGDTDASITGTATMMEGADDILLPIQGTVADGLLVNLGTNNDVTETNSADIKTAVEAIQTAQLPDGHNVTVDNASIAVTGAFYQATQPVSGTVTANLSATDNAVLDDIASDTESLKGYVDNIEGYVDGIETVLGTIDGDTGAIKTAVETLDNAISGSEMQVDVVASLPAGTNAIGKLSANSGVDIGDVDVTSLPALPAGTNAIGKVGHDITGIGHGVKTVTTAGTDVALASSTACKKVDIQAQTDNTGVIAIGASGVDATVATGTGILLNAGDIYSFEIDNLADVYIDSTVNGDGVRFTYYS
jgi:tetrahydromethanopterin S-methyltransferase subunit B